MGTVEKKFQRVSHEGGKRAVKHRKGDQCGRERRREFFFFSFVDDDDDDVDVGALQSPKSDTSRALKASFLVLIIHIDTATMVHRHLRQPQGWNRGGEKERASGNEGKRSCSTNASREKQNKGSSLTQGFFLPLVALFSLGAPPDAEREPGGSAELVRGGGGRRETATREDRKQCE